MSIEEKRNNFNEYNKIRIKVSDTLEKLYIIIFCKMALVDYNLKKMSVIWVIELMWEGEVGETVTIQCKDMATPPTYLIK